MQKIQIDSKYDIIKSSIPIGSGFCARCYRCKDGNVFKEFKKNEDGQAIVERKDLETIMEALYKSSNESIIGPKTLVYQDKKFVGYIYEHIKGIELFSISPLARINTLFDNVDILLKDIKSLTKNRVELFDTHGKNILFDGKYHVIDMDKSIIAKDDLSDEKLEKFNKQAVLITILNAVYGFKPWHEGTYTGVDVNDYIYRKDITADSLRELKEEFERVCRTKNPRLLKIKRRTLHERHINTYSPYVSDID